MMAGTTTHKAFESYSIEIALLADETYYVSLMATTIDDEEQKLLSQEIDTRRGVALDEVLAIIRSALIAPG